MKKLFILITFLTIFLSSFAQLMQNGKYRGIFETIIEIVDDSVIITNMGMISSIYRGKCIKKKGKTILYVLKDVKKGRYISSDTSSYFSLPDSIYLSLILVNDYWESVTYRNIKIYLNDSLIKRISIGPTDGIEMLIPRNYEKYHFTIKHHKIFPIKTKAFSTEKPRYIMVNLIPKKQKIKPQKKVIRYSKKGDYWYMGKRKWGRIFQKI